MKESNQCRNCASEESEPVEKMHQCNFDAETGEIFPPAPGENLHTNNIESNNNMSNTNPISLYYQKTKPIDEMMRRLHIWSLSERILIMTL